MWSLIFDFSIQYEFGSLIQNQEKTIPGTTLSFSVPFIKDIIFYFTLGNKPS